MTADLAIRRDLTPAVFQLVQQVAPVMHEARLFGTLSPNQAAAVMLKGYELGLPLATSFEFIHIVEGKPTLSPRGALALIYASGEMTGLKIEDFEQGCTVWMKRRNGVEYTCTWTIDDAKKAGIFKPASNWEKYGPNMCRWRAIGFCADIVFPDVTGGMKRADELGVGINTNGEVIPATEAEWVEVKGTSLDALVERFGVDTVMAAADGVIPGTEEQLATVAAKLGA